MYKDEIDTKNRYLYVDVACWECKRLVALSNTVEYKGRKFCLRCDEKLRPFSKVILKACEARLKEGKE